MPQSIRTNLVDDFRNQRALYEAFTEACERLVRTLFDSSSVQLHKIESRTKDSERLEGKVNRKDKSYSSLEEVTDLAGVRIITFFADDGPKVAELIHANFDVDAAESVNKGDELATDQFGYVSDHFVVTFPEERWKLPDFKAYKGLFCEIQVRSILQHAWAEIEHDLGYKAEGDIPRKIRRQFSRLAGMIELADDEFMRIRDDLSSYAKDVHQRVVDQLADSVELDATSLQIAVRSSEVIQRVDAKISLVTGSGNGSTDATSDSLSSRDVRALHDLGITSVGQLETLLSDQAEKIGEFTASWINRPNNEFDPGSNFSPGISVFYLIYLQLVSEHDREFIAQFLAQVYGWNKTDGTAQELLAVWDKMNSLD